jgi:hypothetical protein
MTAARRQRKSLLAGMVLVGMALAGTALAFGWFGGGVAVQAATTERVVTDWHTGLAISGYDPVAYFTDAKPVLGNQDIEMRYAGAVWRFHNAGNRDAFEAHPDVYMPQYGGYDPVSAARGVAVAGNPMIWLVTGERLYLFYNQAARESFGGDPERVIGAATRKWPALLQTLTP